MHCLVDGDTMQSAKGLEPAVLDIVMYIPATTSADDQIDRHKVWMKLIQES